MNVFFGIFSPIRNDLQTYMGYDIMKFRDNVRFAEIMVSREGGNNNTAPLYFDGAVNVFRELPLPNDKSAIEMVYKVLDRIRGKVPSVAMLNIKLNNNKLKSKSLWQKLLAYLVCQVRGKRHLQ